MPARDMRQVPLSAISISPLNTRKNLSAGTEDAGLQDLARSIQTNGLINPPTVRELGDGVYEVIAGQRRVLACKQLGWTTIEVFVGDMPDNQALGTSLVENLQRADMHPLDKAEALKHLVAAHGSEAEAGRQTGLSAATVRKYLSLLKLPAELQSRLGTGDGATGIGVMARLANTFSDSDEMLEAYGMIGSFKGSTAEDILRHSGGDIEALEDLRERALEGEFDVHRCGSSLLQCPWLAEEDDQVRERIVSAIYRR